MSQPGEEATARTTAQDEPVPMEATETTALSTEMAPMPLTQRLFRGHDPFAEFSPDPFSGGGSHRLFGGSFGRIAQRLENLSEEILGVRPMLPPQEAASIPGASRYSVQTASMSSFLGSDGQMHTEQFASSDVGDRGHDIRETHQAYANSATGEQKRALEQHMGKHGMKTVKWRSGQQAAEESNEMVLGMENSAEAREAFRKDFAGKAEHLPEHKPFTGRFFAGFGAGDARLPGAAGWRHQDALEGSKGGA
eukprot:TRINITY_DN10773_c0_g1_i1.p1 TRINITY_DN10773_c0_g1~~TRINITY_DN10773_c0_g1_i1.p1  ORF type:complete len:251 (-),score=58.86 TRINITY_DN10773_c0_g1_i1:105-857(-)